MGIVKDFYKNSIFEHYGFEYGIHSGPKGEEGYTRTFKHDDGFYVLWVTINGRTLYLYDEYDCGGMVYEEEIHIPEEYQTNQEVLDYVDEVVTTYIKE